MKYILLLLLTISLNSFAQDYNALITKYRDEYKEDFVKEDQSPLSAADIKYLHFFDPDSTYRVTADIELLLNEDPFQLPTLNGYSHKYIRAAIIRFSLQGQRRQLTLYKSVRLSKMPEHKDDLFLPFTDETNGTETYGGGRYIDLTSNDIKEGRIEIDFNKAYNPYCAYSDRGYQCPKPPAENNLALKIAAGEKKFGVEKKH